MRTYSNRTTKRPKPNRGRPTTTTPLLFFKSRSRSGSNNSFSALNESYDMNQSHTQIIEPKLEIMTPNLKRTGVIVVKCGMTALWDKWGARVPISILWLDDNIISQVKTPQNEGISALQIRCRHKKEKRLTKPEVGHFRAQGVPMKTKLREFPVSEDALLPLGFSIGVRHFAPSQFVDVTGITRGRKMSGRMGGKQRTVKNVWVYKIDPARNLMWVRGQVSRHRIGARSIKLAHVLSSQPLCLTSRFQVRSSQGCFGVFQIHPFVSVLY